MSQNRRTNQSSGTGLFIIITVIFLGISVTQTAKGYQLMFGKHLSWVIAFALGVLMLNFSIEMRKHRAQGRQVAGLLLSYLLCALISFFGNFNAFYTQYNTNELLKKELQKHKEEFTSIVTKSTVALQDADLSTNNLMTEVPQLRDQLVMQINDPANPGIGDRAG